MPELRPMRVSDQWVVDLEVHEIVFRVDFDLVGDDGLMRVSTRFIRGRRPPQPGANVYLLDDGGRGCVAVVEDAVGSYAHVRPDWSTWTGGQLPAKAAGRR
jgi:hypothetical protein